MKPTPSGPFSLRAFPSVSAKRMDFAPPLSRACFLYWLLGRLAASGSHSRPDNDLRLFASTPFLFFFPVPTRKSPSHPSEHPERRRSRSPRGPQTGYPPKEKVPETAVISRNFPARPPGDGGCGRKPVLPIRPSLTQPPVDVNPNTNPLRPAFESAIL